VTNRPQNTVVRRAARVLAILPAILVTLAASAAFAEPPETWEDTPSVSGLHVIVLLVIIPVALFLLIWLLVYIPSMARGERYKPGQAWRSEPEWFGGPRRGVEALEGGEHQHAVGAGASEEHGETRGGASARW
jgi:hypothetical protein